MCAAARSEAGLVARQRRCRRSARTRHRPARPDSRRRRRPAARRADVAGGLACVPAGGPPCRRRLRLGLRMRVMPCRVLAHDYLRCRPPARDRSTVRPLARRQPAWALAVRRLAHRARNGRFRVRFAYFAVPFLALGARGPGPRAPNAPRLTRRSRHRPALGPCQNPVVPCAPPSATSPGSVSAEDLTAHSGQILSTNAKQPMTRSPERPARRQVQAHRRCQVPSAPPHDRIDLRPVKAYDVACPGRGKRSCTCAPGGGGRARACSR
jgi:hypothetical protein